MYSIGLALVNANVNNNATTAAIPIATVPDNLVNCAIAIATKAIANEGINIFKPNLSAFNWANVVSSCFKVPMFICFKADNIAITIISVPTTAGGSNLPNIKIADTIPQKRAVPILVLWFLSFKVNTIVVAMYSPIMI